MTKDIQIKYIDETDTWVDLYPKTKTHIVENESGQTVEQLLNDKADQSTVYTKSEVYTKDEVYTKSEVYKKGEVYDKTEVDNKITSIEPQGIPVSSTEPQEVDMWFELI